MLLVALVSVVFGTTVASGSAPLSFAGANSTEAGVIEFKLYGSHAEDTVSQTLEAADWNVTIFEPLEIRQSL